MIKNVTATLMDVYGYDHCGFITHPLQDKYDVMLVSGKVSILLTDDINAEVVTMRIIHQEKSSTTRIPYIRNDYADIILSALLEFAIDNLKSD